MLSFYGTWILIVEIVLAEEGKLRRWIAIYRE